MRKLKVVLDVQHAGKPSRPGDRGAVQAGGLEEVSLTRVYLDHADRELRRLGHEVIPLSDGEYSDRWRRADSYGADVYVAGHVNAGGGSYALITYDHRSTRGPVLAAEVAAGWREHASVADVRVHAARPDTNGVPRDGDFSEAFACIAGVRAAAILVEPFFLDGPPDHRAWALAHLQQLGEGLAQGIHSWAQLATTDV